MKILCVLLLHFPLCCEVLRQPSLKGQPIIITHTTGSQRLVLDCSPELNGLQRYMPLQQALSHKGNTNLITADIPYYRSKFTELLEALENVSPLVEGIEPGSIYIGVDGLQLIYPDNKDIIKTVFDTIPDIFTPRIGLATNKFLAYLAAISCPDGGHRILGGDATAFLQDLSCDLLPVSIKSRQKLHDFGLNNLGQLSELALGPLLSQFGRDGKKLYNLARGWDDTPLNPRLMAEAIEESVTLPSVTVSLEAILLALESLLVRVFNKIGRVGLGICELNVWTRTWNGLQWEQTIRFKEPAVGTKGVVNRIKQRLEDHPQRGSVEHAGLRVTRLGYPHGRQSNLLPEVRAQDHLMEDIRQLELRLGNPQVYKLQEVEPWSRIPERRYVLEPTNR